MVRLPWSIVYLPGVSCANHVHVKTRCPNMNTAGMYSYNKILSAINLSIAT